MAFPTICLTESRLYPGDWPVLTMDMNTDVSVQLELKDSDGDPVDLAGLSVCLLAAESFKRAQDVYFNKDAVVVDASLGIIRFDFSASELSRNGIFLAQLVTKTGDVELRRYPAYVEVVGDLFDQTANDRLTIAELRYYIRDRWDGENYLLDSLEFSAADIAIAMRRCVDYWNGSLPPLRQQITLKNFPSREHMARGTIGFLLEMAASNLVRNRMQYRATGASVDDQSRADDYLRRSQQMQAEFKQWVLQSKRSINMRGFIGSTGIPEFGLRRYNSGRE